jgi:hypothetical protein
MQEKLDLMIETTVVIRIKMELLHQQDSYDENKVCDQKINVKINTSLRELKQEQDAKHAWDFF